MIFVLPSSPRIVLLTNLTDVKMEDAEKISSNVLPFPFAQSATKCVLTKLVSSPTLLVLSNQDVQMTNHSTVKINHVLLIQRIAQRESLAQESDKSFVQTRLVSTTLLSAQHSAFVSQDSCHSTTALREWLSSSNVLTVPVEKIERTVQEPRLVVITLLCVLITLVEINVLSSVLSLPEEKDSCRNLMCFLAIAMRITSSFAQVVSVLPTTSIVLMWKLVKLVSSDALINLASKMSSNVSLRSVNQVSTPVGMEDVSLIHLPVQREALARLSTQPSVLTEHVSRTLKNVMNTCHVQRIWATDVLQESADVTRVNAQ
jgi:hypothetical protein